MLTLLTEREDLDWLYDVHMPATLRDTRPHCTFALLYGNEDAPDTIECYQTNAGHEYQRPPFLILEAQP